jgi:hypothetical protein
MEMDYELTISGLQINYEWIMSWLQNYEWKSMWMNSIHHVTMSNIGVWHCCPIFNFQVHESKPMTQLFSMAIKTNLSQFSLKPPLNYGEGLWS